MAIKIKTEKILLQGEKAYKVLDIEALEKRQLPIRYLALEGSVYKKGGSPIALCISRTRSDYDRVLSVRGEYSPQEFNERLKLIRKAGEMLRKVNKELDKENAGWDGVETIII
jgi:hypothetical protein